MSAQAEAAPATHKAQTRHAAGTAFLGMVMFMASWAMLFAGLFFAYGIARNGAMEWPPHDLPRLPLIRPAVATLAIALSSGLLQQGYNRLRAGVDKGLVLRLVGALAGGTLFMLLQSSTWNELWDKGLRPATGTYASIFYTLTVFHALHVAVGLGGLLLVTIKAGQGRYNRDSHVGLRLWGLYWHMVGVIWAAIFVSVYLF